MARHWSVRAACTAAVVAAVLACTAAPASAHNYPVAYAPTEGSVVTEQPGLIRVTTNDALLDLDGAGSSSAMLVKGPKGAAAPLYYGDGCVTLLGPTAETKAQLGEPGEYTVVWQVVSTDGHPVSGEYSFTWQPAAGQELAKGSATAPDCGGKAAKEPAPSATDAAGTGASADAALADVAWIGGALGAVLLAVLGTLFVLRRKNPTPPTEPTP